MFSNFSTSRQHTDFTFSLSADLAFSDYISLSRAMIEARRADMHLNHAQLIIDANSPYELQPTQPLLQNQRIKYGVLLIHGLLDSPFSLREIGADLQARGILSRAMLLPGHGTTPADLLSVSYQDWIQTVRYGIETLRRDVEHIFLIGYSTGAALSIYHALQDSNIAGLILLSPAVKIKAPVDMVVALQALKKTLSWKDREWIFKKRELDYAKYCSITFNAVNQVAKLTALIRNLRQQHALHSPVLMITSREDETISSDHAIEFFSQLSHKKNQLLLYTPYDHDYTDSRIITRPSHYPDLSIKHLAHAAIPFSPSNSHYGQKGDYLFASRLGKENQIYGAYNLIEETVSQFLHRCGLLKHKKHSLTYNPDFAYMMETIATFIIGKHF